MMLESKDLLSSNFFHTNLVVFEIQTLIKSHSLMPRASGIGQKVYGGWARAFGNVADKKHDPPLRFGAKLIENNYSKT